MAFKKKADFTFTWKIENFSMLVQKKGEKLCSPAFDVEGLYNTEWLMNFYPKGNEIEDHYAVFLRRSKKDGGPDNISVGFKLSILPADEGPDGILSKNLATTEFAVDSAWGFGSFTKMSHVLEKSDLYLPNDTLSLRCEMWRDNPEKKTLKECVARTRVNVERIAHLWPIKKFSSIQSGQENGVTVEIYKKVSMKLHWRTDTEKGEGGASVENVYLHIVRTKQEKPTLLDAHIAILDSEGKPRNVIKGKKFFESVTEDEKHEFLISKRKALIENKATYTPNDVLTLQCELMVSDGVERSAIEESKYMSPPFQNANSNMSNLVEDLRAAYKKQQFADVKLRAGGKVFPAHCVVLCARSEVFRQMLNAKKSKTNEDFNSKEDESENAISSNKREEVVSNNDINDKSDVNNKADDSAIEASKDDQENDSTIPANQDQENDSNNSNNQEDGNISAQTENSNLENREIDSTAAGVQNTEKDSNSIDNGNGSQDNQIDSTIDGNGSKENNSASNTSQENESYKDVNELEIKIVSEIEEPNFESTMEDDQNKAKDSIKNANKITLDNSNADLKEDKHVQTDVNNLETVAKPKQDGESDVLDLDDNAETLEQLLDFLYTDKLGDLDIPSVKDLYCAAVKYKIAPLVTKCLDFLRSSITVDNICDFLEFADLHNVEKLKNFGQAFITTHMANILLSKQWQSFAIRKRHLVEKTCRDLRNKRRKLDT